MPIILNTSGVKEPERFDYWHQWTCQSFSLTDCRRESSDHSRPKHRPGIWDRLNSATVYLRAGTLCALSAARVTSDSMRAIITNLWWCFAAIFLFSRPAEKRGWLWAT